MIKYKITVKEILEDRYIDFKNKCWDRVLKRMRVHINETVNKAREIESIELNMNDNLLMYLNNGGEPNPDGGDSPFSVVSRSRFMINPVNIKICIYMLQSIFFTKISLLLTVFMKINFYNIYNKKIE